MPDYEKLYHKAFNALTDAEHLIQQAETFMLRANAIITAAQQQCEDLYCEDEQEASDSEKK